MKITGQIAAVRWGYRPVASLARWTFTGDNNGGTFTAQVTSHDAFGLDQAPLVVVVPTEKTQWRWPVRDITVTGSSLSAAVGPRE
jgi:hypothetical protein